eukprot:gene32164-38904_t
MRVVVKRTGTIEEGFFVDWYEGMHIVDLKEAIADEREKVLNDSFAIVARIHAGTTECMFSDSVPEPLEGVVGSITLPYLYDVEVIQVTPAVAPPSAFMAVAQWKEQFLFELSSVTVDTFSEGMTESIHGEHLLVKKLPEVFRQRYGSIPKKVYVRDCYRTLYKLASDSMVDVTRDFGVTLFTGIPGIGKSLFLVYFIFRFLTDERFKDKCFALEFTSSRYVFFQPTGAQGEFWCSSLDGAGMRSKQFLLLCDIVEIAEPVSRAKWTYIFSYPAPGRYKQTLKNSPCQRYTLPTWSELELLFVNADSDSCALNPHILMMDEALEQKGGAIAESFFKCGFGIADCLQSYMLVHINPPLSADGEFNYSGWKLYTFASDAIFQLLAKHHSTQMLAGAVAMFNVDTASHDFVSADKLFEKVCLWLKPLDGMRFTATALSDAASTSVFEVPSVREVLARDWKKTARLVPGVLYVPRISNLDSGDSLYLAPLPFGGYLLVALRITVGKAHPVKVNGLHDILLAYTNDVRAQVVSKALVFVLPAYDELDGEQALHTQKEENMDSARVPVAVRDFEQVPVVRKAGLYASSLGEDREGGNLGESSSEREGSGEQTEVKSPIQTYSGSSRVADGEKWDSASESESDDEEDADAVAAGKKEKEGSGGGERSEEEAGEHFEMGRESSLSPHYMLTWCYPSSISCLLPWDEGAVGESLWGLLYKGAGYAGACAWHVWATSFFQTVLPAPWARGLGLLLYAFTYSLIVAAVMALASLRQEMRGSSGGRKIGGGRRHHMLLFTSFSSLLVGWAWKSFFISITSPLLPSSSQRGVSAVVDGCLAFTACAEGGRLEYLIVKRRSAEVLLNSNGPYLLY